MKDLVEYGTSQTVRPFTSFPPPFVQQMVLFHSFPYS